jgi:hypothetical protein
MTGLPEPVTLSDTNKSDLCEKCKAIDEQEIILTFSGSDHAPSERRFRVLDTVAGREIRSLKRDMVLDLYLQREDFWQRVKLVRNRWGIEPATDFPSSPIYGELLPPGLPDQPPPGLEAEQTAWFEKYEAWIRDLEYIARAKIPLFILVRSFARIGARLYRCACTSSHRCPARCLR